MAFSHKQRRTFYRFIMKPRANVLNVIDLKQAWVKLPRGQGLFMSRGLSKAVEILWVDMELSITKNPPVT